MEIRRARPEDAEGFAAAFAAVAEEGDLILTEPPVDVEEFARRVRERIADGERPLWVTVEDGVVVGGLGLDPVPHAPGVMELGVHLLPAARGRGAGRALMEAALAAAAAAGAHKVGLEVFTTNARAIRLYERLGFEVEGTRRDHYRRRDGSLRSVLIMARRLGG